MKEFLLSMTLVIVSCGSLYAQKKQNHLKIHGGVDMPVGYFGDNYNTGWGIFVTDYYGVSEKGSIFFSAGLSRWKAKNADITGGLSQLKFGYRHFMVSGLYLQADGGLAKYVGNWGDGSRFAYSGGLGYLIRIKGNSGVDLGIKISRVPTRTWVGYGIGYQFKF